MLLSDKNQMTNVSECEGKELVKILGSGPKS